MSNGVGELHIRIAILELMADRRVWSNAELKKKLVVSLPLSQHDRERANKRENEARWENRVNCALSPSRPNSLYASRWVENAGHGLHRITDAGHDYAMSD